MTGPQLTQVAGLPIGDPDLAAAVSDGLDRVEDLLRREVHSDYRFVTDTSLHLIEAGGKRFRPLLTLLLGIAPTLALEWASAGPFVG